MDKLHNKMMKYFSKHQAFNAYVHFLAGMGAGILITYPVVREHPLRWGFAFLLLSFLGHVYAATVKKS